MAENTTRRSALAFGVSALGLAFVPTQVRAGPIDGYPRAQVRQWLLDELEDLFQIFAADGDYDDEDIEDAVMDLLSDLPKIASPKHRQAHQYLSQAALDAEMKEAGTTLRAVVHAAILQADAMSFIQPPRDRVIAATWKEERHADAGFSSAGLLLAQRSLNGKAKPKDARVTVADGVTAVVFRQ
jgi:hypothetical protein